MLTIISKLKALNQLTTIMQVFSGPSNLSQESPTWVNTLTTHGQDRLHLFISIRFRLSYVLK